MGKNINMKPILLSLALLAGTANAELVTHQSKIDPTTNKIATWAYYSELVLLSQNIALGNVIAGDNQVIMFVKNCHPKSRGGEVEQFVKGGDTLNSIWVVGGASMLDVTATSICINGLKNQRNLK